MRTRLRTVVLTVAALNLASPMARGVVYRAAATSGLMLQPTSSYFHYVYGGILDVAANRESVIFHAGYVERPAFDAAGFRDQEFCGFAALGTKLSGGTRTAFYAYAGAGQMTGFVAQKADTDDLGLHKRRYRLRGPLFAMEYLVRLGPMTAAVSHQTLITYVDDYQLEARVAWPFNFMFLSLGLSI